MGKRLFECYHCGFVGGLERFEVDSEPSETWCEECDEEVVLDNCDSWWDEK